MPITISNTRQLPGERSRGAGGYTNVMRHLKPGQSFFVADEEGSRNALGSMATRVRKETGNNLATRRMTEDGKRGTGIFCLPPEKKPALKSVK